jgi:hypothetical protein
MLPRHTLDAHRCFHGNALLAEAAGQRLGRVLVFVRQEMIAALEDGGPFSWSRRTISAFRAGSTPPWASSMPATRAICLAARSLLPVSRTGLTRAPLSATTVCAAAAKMKG